jgi:hypothetical protein
MCDINRSSTEPPSAQKIIIYCFKNINFIGINSVLILSVCQSRQELLTAGQQLLKTQGES